MSKKLKINVTGNVKQVNGQDAKFQDQILTMRSALIQALCTVYDPDKGNPMENGLYRMELAEAVTKQDVVAMTLADIMMIAPLIARHFVHPLVLRSFLQAVEDGIPVQGSSVEALAGTPSLQLSEVLEPHAAPSTPSPE